MKTKRSPHSSNYFQDFDYSAAFSRLSCSVLSENDPSQYYLFFLNVCASIKVTMYFNSVVSKYILICDVCKQYLKRINELYFCLQEKKAFVYKSELIIFHQFKICCLSCSFLFRFRKYF